MADTEKISLSGCSSVPAAPQPHQALASETPGSSRTIGPIGENSTFFIKIFTCLPEYPGVT